jgi:glycine/D-amino acid oxidase-like deaminating enzyme
VTEHDTRDPRTLSFWLDSLEPTADDLAPRPPLPGDTDAGVAIVGAGFTGLWTAYYLTERDPTLRIVVLEKEFAGYGASGRNGGWCSALFPAGHAKIARVAGVDAAHAMRRAMNATVDEVGRVAAAEGIDCGFAKGGTVVAARTPVQLARARAEIAASRAVGVGEEDLRLLDAAETHAMLRASHVLGGTYTPHCAALHPAALVRGLARAVVARGVRLYEGTPVTAIRQGSVTTPRGRVRAPVVIRATEGYTAALPGERRTLAPVYSLMIATEPLSESAWDAVGLSARQTFADHRHLIIYGQRTADGRLAFGGRGAPYHFGSRVRPGYDTVPRVHAALHETLVELFPALAGVRVTHAWGGALGVPRDWFASVGYDHAAGLAWAGGYVGDGVGTTNLAGRTLADLIAGQHTDLTRLPWVGHRSARWEPEPLRWLGINLGLRVMTAADAEEARTGRPSLLAKTFARFLGE